MPDLVAPDPWTALRRHTPARLALGRAGASLPTAAQLAFALDHALARDAVHAAFDPAALAAQLAPLAPVLTLASAAPDRRTYLQRPDLGRRLADAARASLPSPPHPPPDLAIILSAGLSALAAARQIQPLLAAFLPAWRAAGHTLAPLCIVPFARVGLLNDLGPALGARLALILLGERPGLGTPDSLGAYFAHAPAGTQTDADRNCISNIHPAGLPPPAAAAKLHAWLTLALTTGSSGFTLKEPAAIPALPAPPASIA